jgi:hypothetical protein
MIVGLDPWWMKITTDQAEPETAASRDTEASPSISAAAHLEALRLFFAKPHFPPALLRPSSPVVEPGSGRPAIGLGALAGNGYRQDGSVLQSNVVEDYLRTRQYRDRETPPVIERIRGHSHQFAPTPGLDWKQAERIIAALRKLRAAGTEVYVVLPPFSKEADAALSIDPALSRWYAEYRQDLPHRLTVEGFVCANTRTPADYGMTDEAMMDGFHPGDVLVTWILGNLIIQAPRGSLLATVPLEVLGKLREAPGVVPVALDPPALKP